MFSSTLLHQYGLMSHRSSAGTYWHEFIDLKPVSEDGFSAVYNLHPTYHLLNNREKVSPSHTATVCVSPLIQYLRAF